MFHNCSYKAGLLKNDVIIIYFQIETNLLQVDTSHTTVPYLAHCPKRLHFRLQNYSKTPFPSTLTNLSFTLNVTLVKCQCMGQESVFVKKKYCNIWLTEQIGGCILHHLQNLHKSVSSLHTLLFGPWNDYHPPPLTHPYQYLHSCSKTHVHKIINAPVFIWRVDIMILMRANPLLGPLL